MKSWKKMAAIAAAFCAVTGFSMVSEAAYQLSDEVKAPTKALLQATQIGVKTYENADLQNLPNKDAILVMSFGTTFKDTRAKTIDATVEAIKAANPDKKVVVAYTSHIIINRVKKNEGITIPTPEEAVAQLKADGYTRVAFTSLDIIPGIEYAYKEAVYNQYKDQFKKATLATPLMYYQGQEEQPDDVKDVMQAFSSQFPAKAKGKAVMIMAHGTPHPANAYYSVMQARLNEIGRDDAIIYSVEGWPHLDTAIDILKDKKIKEVTLMPLMMVAGDHANNDMAGDEDDSHKVILQKKGIKVNTYIHGAGENAKIREQFVARVNAAVEALVK